MRIANSIIPVCYQQTYTLICQERSIGQKIVMMQDLLSALDSREAEVKHRMQDRMKFMSGKNVMKADRELEQIEKARELVKSELSELQDRI